MKKKYISMLGALVIAGNIMFMPHIVKAEDNSAEILVEEALKEKNFYSYNMAYFEISKLKDENQKAELSNKLLTIADIVWSSDIKELNAILQAMVKTSSGRIYDELEAKIKASNIVQIDKEYLLGELTSWGRKLVWTQDYAAGVDSIINAWTSNTDENITKAEEIVKKVQNTYSREYLEEELSGAKKKFYSNEVNFFTKLKSAKADIKSDELHIAEKIKDILKNTSLVQIPEQYINSDEYYILLTLMMEYDLKSDIPGLQKQLDTFIAVTELSKLKGNTNVPADAVGVENPVIKANTGTGEIDVTDKAIAFYLPLLVETKLNIISAGYDPATDTTKISDYLEVKDGKVYLKPKAIEGSMVTEKIKYTVTYKGITIPSSINIVIAQ